MARVMTYVLIWLALTAEVRHMIFESQWETWLTLVGTFLFNGLPVIHIYPWDMLLWFTLAAAYPGIRKKRVRPLLKSIWITLGGVALMWTWGVVRGGIAYQTIFQLHTFVIGFFVAWLVMATIQTPAHIRTLGKVIVFAAVYRAFVLLAFWYFVARHLKEQLATLTDHADSVLFVSALFILVTHTLERVTFMRVLGTLLMTALMMVAITLNNRRIAWLDVGLAYALSYLLLPQGKTKRRMTSTLIGLSPAIAAYLAIGWGHPTGVFKPVGSISSMFGEHQDVSSMMRDIENYNLLRTLKGHIFMGSGFGHEYVEEVRAFDISGIFPQYRFLPHNSLLGVIAFTGMIGFALIWQVFPVAIFLLARVCSMSRHPTYRVAAHASLISLATVIVQYWGDVGFNHQMVNVMAGIAVGLAGRLPVLAGCWPAAAAARSLQPAAAARAAASRAGSHAPAVAYNRGRM